MTKQSSLPIYIGWDKAEPAAWAVAAHSILTRASAPVSLHPLTRQSLAHVYTRERGPLESTDFSMTRFLVPYLQGYQGYALFVDCDVLCLSDVWGLMLYALADPGKAVYVAQHDYTPKSARKFLGQQQTTYAKKNWSSVMLFDCAQCQRLTPEYVNTASGKDLHQFAWLENGQIGALPREWNWLVGEYPANPQAKLLHYTLGTPCLPGYAHSDHAGQWFEEFSRMSGTTPLDLVIPNVRA